MHTFMVNGKTISIFPSAKPESPILYLNTFSKEGQNVFKAAQAAGCPPFTLAVISDLDWNHDMAPWDCPPAFKNAEPCTGGADEYLQLLTEEIISRTEMSLPAIPCWRGIVGYSLAGLFALYSLYQTNMFSRAASVSGSLWFPGIKEYITSHQPKRRPDSIYFSLGDKESKTRNPILKNVRQNTEAINAFYQTQGIDTVFHLNAGSHYEHATERTAAGICWLLNQ